MRNKAYLLAIFFLLFSSFVYAPPPFVQQSEGTNDLQIRISDIPYIKVNTAYTSKTHVFNRTTGLPVTTDTNCSLHIYNEDLKHIFEGYTLTVEHGFDFEIPIPATVFSYAGFYPFIIQCKNANQGGFKSYYVEATEDGKAPRPGFNLAVFAGYLIVIFILIGFMHSYKKDLGATVVYGTVGFTLSVLYVWGLYASDILHFDGNLQLWLSGLVLAVGLYCLVIAWAFYNDIKARRSIHD